MEEVLTVLPFGGTFDMVQMKGSTLKKVFEHSVRKYGKMYGEFLQVSGLLTTLFGCIEHFRTRTVLTQTHLFL